MEIRTDQSREVQSQNPEIYFPVVASYAERLARVVETEDWLAAEASVCLPRAHVLLEEVQTTVGAIVGSGVRYVFLVGIGGSSLGTQAIHRALAALCYDTVQTPELIVLDTVDPHQVRRLAARFATGLDSAQYVVFLVSKSGSTTETIANAELLYQQVLTDPVARTERTVVITDAKSSLEQYAHAHTISRLTIPHAVGGRYSVFSPVGIAPLLALGHDVSALLQGASDIVPYCTHQDIWHNPAALTAALAYRFYERDYVVYDTFVFAPALEAVGAWQRQLLGESIGKRWNTRGEEIETGFVPTTSVGSTDLHSVGQLYLGGVRTIFTMFVTVQDRLNLTLPDKEERALPQLVAEVTGQSTRAINQAIEAGTMAAYNEDARPYVVAQLAELSPYELGVFMQCKMLETMYLGRLFDVDPFTQPNVERYKVFTKEFLTSDT